MLPCSRQEQQLRKPTAVPVPLNPTTIGEHIRKKRIESSLLQADVAKILNVSEDCVAYWENNRSNPQIQYFPHIIRFLGYCPLEFDETKFGGQLKAYRWRNGLSNEKLGALLGVHGSTILAWENGKSQPQQKHLKNFSVLLQECI